MKKAIAMILVVAIVMSFGITHAFAAIDYYGTLPGGGTSWKYLGRDYNAGSTGYNDCESMTYSTYNARWIVNNDNNGDQVEGIWHALGFHNYTYDYSFTADALLTARNNTLVSSNNVVEGNFGG